MTSIRGLLALLLLLSSSAALCSQSERFSFAVSAQISSRDSAQNVKIEGAGDQLAAEKAFRLVKDDFQLELMPKSRDSEGVLFLYRVSKKGTSLVSGEVHARNGQKTHLLLGEKKSGHLVKIALRLPGQNVPFSTAEPKLLKEIPARDKGLYRSL